ncbi:asparaginase [Marivita sp. XM-24bin2]|jgi:L-asparaginase II|uniref:asparaginase n=1 Tax=unclassified Marivita TaxID=2632480 RepID=UPI000D7B22EB|nr:asparaginase [Marivita sp. XM-24bin2]MCR9109745.1 asparaginase [Paracoccaceae bacterium]PWL35283.1 MAG: L-asparaginase [Marivita sp. XM-24bin2]
MANAAPLAEVWRGPFLESHHSGHAVICDGSGGIIAAWGDPEAVVLPRSSSKMIQALPLITSGAADARGLTSEQLALACASHEGAPIHVDMVNAWLSDLGLGDDALCCGPQVSRDKELKLEMIRAFEAPCRVHNNCSGKHAGFLTLAQHLGAGPNYVDPEHAVQKACLEAFEAVTDQTSPGFGIDGCSAPNFATTMHGMARAMAWFATSAQRSDGLSKAAARLVDAMYSHPLLVAGEGRACTRLMRASKEPVALKTGAEGYFIAILPKRGLGIAVKAADGATRAAECAIAALLVRLEVLDAQDPGVKAFLNPAILNRDGLVTGEIKPAAGLLAQ